MYTILRCFTSRELQLIQREATEAAAKVSRSARFVHASTFCCFRDASPVCPKATENLAQTRFSLPHLHEALSRRGCVDDGAPRSLFRYNGNLCFTSLLPASTCSISAPSEYLKRLHPRLPSPPADARVCPADPPQPKRIFSNFTTALVTSPSPHHAARHPQPPPGSTRIICCLPTILHPDLDPSSSVSCNPSHVRRCWNAGTNHSRDPQLCQPV